MIAMLLLIIELVFGTWQFSAVACTSYLVFDSMNKFVAPIIVFLISRTCYTTVCLDKTSGERAATLKASPSCRPSPFFVCCPASSLCSWMCDGAPLACLRLFKGVHPHSPSEQHYQGSDVHSEVWIFTPARTRLWAYFLCGRHSLIKDFEIEFWFNVVACITSYAVPLFGIVYWYMSVPFFLKRRALTTLVASSSMDAALRKVITTVLLLTAIYVLCWSPYWVSMFANSIFSNFEKRSMIIVSYFIHLLPYVSCVAYPLIFTLLNRGIRTAHAKIVQDQRRRFRSLTDEASSQIRNAIRSLPSKASSTIRSRMSSYVFEEPRKPEKSDSTSTELIRPQLLGSQAYPSPQVSRAASTINFKGSVSSLDNNDSETLL
ncbi:hypothetical protein ANCCAN_09136 [Ancylostoma caninum]|uniref:G-protein coupled receptors family 1 profile domain-containing protein n=1 Tax=Ancylostoma caninum TaxID=29170 RepID=A0A368GKI1_ANCCA|nr:hypothetical protein ANCCAN_09136 [Ancylostoma caninum]